MPKTSKAKTASKRRNSNRIAAARIAKEEESSLFDVTKEEEGSLFDVTSIPTPLTRKIRCYAFDPSHRRFFGNEMTLEVKWERLVPGPIGERIAVIDYDGANKRFYKPVDLDDPRIFSSSGLTPTESDPRFHQQMVYAVASDTLQNFEAVLGRRIQWRKDERVPDAKGNLIPGARMGDIYRLNFYPHAMISANAAYSPSAKGILFGYFRANTADPGRNFPGQTIFTCLSHDIIVHETTHAILDALRSFFSERTNPDVARVVDAAPAGRARSAHEPHLQPV